MIDRHLSLNIHRRNSKRTMRWQMIVVLLVACLSLLTAVAIAQDDAQPDPKSQTLKLQVVDEEGAAIEDVSLLPSQIVYQRNGLTSYRKSRDQSIVTNEQGEATFFVPVEVKYPVISVLFTVKHDSFVEQTYTADFTDEDVTITLERGLQVAASGLSTLSAPVDWNIRSNGTLISPILGAKESSLRLVQFSRRQSDPIQQTGRPPSA